MEIKKYDTLPDEARRIREEVFVKEQKFKVEFDEIDDTCTHLVMFDNGEAVAVCRYFYSEEKGCYIIGRVAVSKSHRGKKLGSVIMREAERLIKEDGGKAAALSAQCRASKFYGSLGYKVISEPYYDEYCPHVLMKKEL